MSRRDVDIVFTARDEATRRLGKINRAMTRFGDNVRNVALSAGIALGTAGLVRGFMEVVKAASFAEESGNRFNEVFKEQAKVADEFATQLGENVNRSRIRIKDYMSQLQDTFVPLGLTREKAAELSGELVKLGIDVASFKDVSDESVIESFTSALVGQSKAVLKYGIVTNVTALKQELLNQGIKRSFESLTEQEKIMLRYNVIMKSTQDAQGDAARTAGSFANQMKALKDDVFEASAFIGGKALPFMARQIQKLRGGFDNLQTASKNWRAVSELTWASAKLSVIDFSLDIDHLFRNTIPTLLTFFRSNWRDIFTDIWEWTKTVFLNIGRNIRSFFEATASWLAGDGFDFTWTGLLDGFESTLKELPKIAAREMTDLERQLQGQVSKMTAQLAIKFTPAAIEQLAAPGGGLGGAGALAAGATGRQRRGPAAVEARFLTLTSGRMDPQMQVAKNTKETSDTLRKVLAAQERLAALIERNAQNIPGSRQPQLIFSEARV